MLLEVKLSEMSIDSHIIDADVYSIKQSIKILDFLRQIEEKIFTAWLRKRNHCALQGIIAIVAAINPFENQRIELAKKYDAKIICIKCDFKSLLKEIQKAFIIKLCCRMITPDKLWNLTGVNDPYETPENPNLAIDTSEAS